MLEKYYFLPSYYNDEIVFNTKTYFYTDQKFMNYFASTMIWLKIFQNVAIYLFKYFVSYIMTYISILQDKSKFVLLHNFVKYFSGTRVNQIVITDILMVNCLIFSICYFRLGTQWCVQNLYSIKKDWTSARIFLKLCHCKMIQFCLGSISNGFEATESTLKGNVYDFSVNYNAIDKSDVLTFRSI